MSQCNSKKTDCEVTSCVFNTNFDDTNLGRSKALLKSFRCLKCANKDCPLRPLKKYEAYVPTNTSVFSGVKKVKCEFYK